MKKIFTILAAASLSLAAFAETISSDEALNTARRFFGDVPASNLTLVWTGGTNQPTFYAYNNIDGGFVIISAETAVDPVLGYSYTGSFRTDNMPSNLKNWMSLVSDQIRIVRVSKISQSDEVRQMWQDVGMKTKAGSETVLNTALWDQGSPYCLKCPVIKGSYSLTGCVATAMAIILRYNKFPEHGVGTVGGYRTGSEGVQIPSVKIDEFSFDWDDMPTSGPSKSQDWTAHQKEQVSTLMFYCGASVRMDYTPGGSGTQSILVTPALIEHFGANASLVMESGSWYRPVEWKKKISTSIANNHPVYYSAQDARGQGGHAFVLDGYNSENDKVHVNWGWSGSDNGWYAIDLAPVGYTFSAYHQACFDIRPEDGTGKEPKDGLYVYEMTLEGDIESGKESSCNITLCNTKMKEAKGSVSVALLKKDGSFSPVGTPADFTVRAMGRDGSQYITTQSVKFRLNQFSFSDRLIPIYKMEGESDWRAARVDAENIGFSSIPVTDCNFIKVEPVYHPGDEFVFELISGQTPITKIDWYFDNLSTLASKVILTSGKHTVRVVLTDVSNNIETLVQVIEVK